MRIMTNTENRVNKSAAKYEQQMQELKEKFIIQQKQQQNVNIKMKF